MIWILGTVILSALIAGGTWYFLHLDEIKAKNRKNQPVEVEQEKAKKYNIKDLWGIEDIRDGVIKLKGGRFSAVLNMDSIDYNFLSDEEQEAVENVLIKTALSIGFPVQLFTTTQRVDTENTINKIKANMDDSKPAKMKAYADNQISYLESMMADRNVYVRKSYAIVSYDGPFDKAYQELERECEVITTNLHRANIIVTRLNSDEILDVLHLVLNKGTSVKPSALVKDGAFELYVGGVALENQGTN